jgi:hypothetical protein
LAQTRVAIPFATIVASASNLAGLWHKLGRT